MPKRGCSIFVQGTLAGFDQKSNVVLSNSTERVFSSEEGVEEVPLGLYLVKGETMYALSHLDLKGFPQL